MHILVVALHSPSRPTGVCRYAANLAQCLAETDEITQITVIVGAWQENYFAVLFSSPRVNLISVGIKNTSITRNLWFLFGLPRLAHQLDVDLVHLSFPLPILKSLFPCPVVATIHDLYPHEYPSNFGYSAIFNRLLLKQCLSQSNGLTCVSKTTLEALKRYFPKISHKPVEVIYNIVDFKTVTPKAPKVLSDKINTSFLLCVAQHRKNKNLDLLIKAFAHLLEDRQLNKPINLILVGSPGPETEKLYNQVHTQNLEDRVFFLSGLDDGELCWLYEHCSLFVIPSSIEGFCIPLAEALYFGCKVVCSDIPVLREIGSSNCVFFSLEPNPVNNLFNTVNQALKASSHTQSYQNKLFSKCYASTKYLKFYASVIK